MTGKLGKKAKRHDARTLQLSKYLLPTVTAPSSQAWGRKLVPPLGDMGNTKYGDCTCAAAGHLIQTWTANTDKQVNLSTEAILTAYWGTGFDDDGRVMLDILSYWRREGIGGHKIGAYVEINPNDPVEVSLATYLFGGVYVGLAMPANAQGWQNWVVRPGNDKPNSWGGHAVSVQAYTKTGRTCITWGNKLGMSNAFFARYCDEAYAILSSEWVTGPMPAPNGFDLAALTADLARI